MDRETWAEEWNCLFMQSLHLVMPGGITSPRILSVSTRSVRITSRSDDLRLLAKISVN